MNVYDIDNNFALVQSLPIPTTNVRGVVFDPQSGMLYFSDGGNGGANGTGGLIKYDLVTQSVVYRQTYNFGVDSMAITPDGKTIFMPDGSASYDGTWHIINTATGQVTGAILTASGVSPHDTDMSANGQYVYMEGVNSNVLWVASTATGQIVQKVQPFAHAIRPFVVNQSGSLAYATENGLIGFGVGDLQTGHVLYNVSAPGFNLPPGFDTQYSTPSHGISLSPDGKTVYVVDMPNSYVHVFNVSGLPNSAPTMTTSIPIAPISGTESPCKIDCTKEGWLEQSLDGRYLFVGNSGSIIDTTTNKVVANLATLADTRMFLEIDWVNGVPINSEDRTDFYWNSIPSSTPTPAAASTAVSPQQTKVVPKATATHTGLATKSQAPTPTGTRSAQQPGGAQASATGSGQGPGIMAFALIAGAIFLLLAATLVAILCRRKARNRAAQPS
jgi:DNA-binding beta-propeller fold protein YncE